ncbi:MAG: Xaa-Pro peptidase family protein [Elusimicrobia bacterium]|nr:Xaa-Pro peptidase family protein [Elusimicrobiota bacterium]
MADRKINAEILKNFQKQLTKNKIDGYIVTDNVDQLYLTGFTFFAHEAALLITPREIYCFTRDLYVLELGAYAPFMKTSAPLNFAQAAAETAAKLKLKNVCFDAEKTTYLDGKIFDRAGFKSSAFSPGLIRQVKTKTEIAAMREACKIAYKTYEHIKKFIKTGMTEKTVAAEIERYTRVLGALPDIYMIVCFGVNSNNTHNVPTDDKLKDESAILIDYTCVYKNYFSDITRSWWHGKNPPAEYKKIWRIVNTARAAGVKAAKPGITGKDLDLVARNIITAAGYGDYFIHRLGHGIGLEVHENPCAAATNTEKFVQNNVTSIEPGIYLPGKYGVRLEDTVVVDKAGGIILTKP